MTNNVEPRTVNNGPNTRKRVFLVDGNSYLYRAFYATPHLSNSRGIPTNAIYAFISMIKKLRNNESPDTLVIIFDSKEPSFREAISKEYKAQRPPMPGNLITQVPYVKGIVEAMGLPLLEKAGYEADDIIGTIVEHLKNHDDMETYIVTSDKDMMQLISDKVLIYDSMKNQLIREPEVIEKLGVKPTFVIDYLALCGDTSDNIPGVPGIGEKTARELISLLGSMDNIYRNIDTIKKASVKEKLIIGKALGEMSKALATIKVDVPIDVSIETLTAKNEDPQALRKIYRELELMSLYREIQGENNTKREWPKKELAQFHMKTVAILATFHGKNAGTFQLDAFAASDGEGLFFSQNEKDLFEIINGAEEIITHNLKPLLVVASNIRHGFEPATRNPQPATVRFFDTMLAAYLTNPMRKEHGIGSILEEHLDIALTLQGEQSTLTECVPYLFELKDTLLLSMKSLELMNLFSNIEMPLIGVLAEMEQTGVKIDRKMLAELSRDFDKRLTGIVKEIYAFAGDPFNINSPQQLSRVLFDTLRLTPVKKTKTGFSTDTGVLETLSLEHPLPKKILEYRTLTKLKNTYIDVLPTLINSHTGRIHTTLNQMVVATGRLSSSDPNLQNIPIRGEEGMKIRQAFVPENGCLLISSDYSQIELRVLAHISGDPLLVETFLRDEDIHSTVAASIFGVNPDHITQDMRRTAKVINFGIVYGMSAYGLSKELDVSQKEAQHYIDSYFERHSGVKAYMKAIVEEARANGFVRTLFGRVRFMPEINNADQTVRQLGERAAMNTPIQGTAADIIKMAMINITKKIKQRGLTSKLILSIHDELVFEVHVEEASEMEKLIIEEMEHVMTLSVPLKVSIGRGHSWAEAH
ncbi:MAG: DNA polymerase I [Syntrophus sp. (in: bacteria)]|nr:DNA polymerase I [Syntrophus sp. (in: bacteria)]